MYKLLLVFISIIFIYMSNAQDNPIDNINPDAPALAAFGSFDIVGVVGNDTLDGGLGSDVLDGV